MDIPKLTDSRKAKVVGIGVTAILGLVASFKLSPEVAAICIAVIVSAYEIAQAAVDIKWGKSKDAAKA